MKQFYKFLMSVYLATALMAVAQTRNAGPSFNFASQPTQPVSAEAGEAQFKGSRDVLELIADKLDFSDRQKLQLQKLINHEHQSIAELHQNTQMSDEQKSTTFRQIQAQTKEQFVAMLTPGQQREFTKMTR
jgi:hypothetical protein